MGNKRLLKRAAVMSTAFFCLTMFQCFGQTGKSSWKGMVAVENGVKVVKNPAQPLYGEFAFDFKEDLAIGGDPNLETSYFPKGGVLSVDDEGNFYVADFGNRRVQVYDVSGKFVRTIGRQGQGPGEYMFPSRVLFDAEGNVGVSGGSTFNVYTKDGIFKEKIMLKPFLSQFFVGPKGTIIGTTQPVLGPGGPKHSLLQLNADGMLLRTIAVFRGELSESQKTLVIHYYRNRIVFVPLDPGSFYYGFSDEYKIFIADAEGRTVLTFTKEEKSSSITGKEKDETRKNGIYNWSGVEKPEDAVVFPDHRPFFGNFLCDEAGRLYVVRFSSIFEKDGPQAVDVFSKDGIYLYRMIWPFVPAVIKHGTLNHIRTDKDTGEYFVVRYKIKNWAKMKSSAE